mmetsp:Transcript_15427/g.58675  ORF Transcript_15427/g.58675 Transcript_15427/m.58675 type:complete len:216 (+) Transcript_15427:252-899(+)
MAVLPGQLLCIETVQLLFQELVARWNHVEEHLHHWQVATHARNQKRRSSGVSEAIRKVLPDPVVLVRLDSRTSEIHFETFAKSHAQQVCVASVAGHPHHERSTAFCKVFARDSICFLLDRVLGGVVVQEALPLVIIFNCRSRWRSHALGQPFLSEPFLDPAQQDIQKLCHRGVEESSGAAFSTLHHVMRSARCAPGLLEEAALAEVPPMPLLLRP